MPFGNVRRRRVFAVLLALSVAMPFNSDIMAGLGHGGAALLAALRDPAALIAGRSPGSRGTDLIQSKPAAKAAPKPEPTERVLTEVRERPEIAGLPVVSTAPPQFALMTPSLVQPFAPHLPFGVPGGGGGQGVVRVEAPSYGGGGGPVNPTTPPTSGVPEPSTWAIMILGVFGAGIGLRRRRRSHAQAVNA